jgi:hypothetical protein
MDDLEEGWICGCREIVVKLKAGASTTGPKVFGNVYCPNGKWPTFSKIIGCRHNWVGFQKGCDNLPTFADGFYFDTVSKEFEVIVDALLSSRLI